MHEHIPKLSVIQQEGFELLLQRSTFLHAMALRQIVLCLPFHRVRRENTDRVEMTTTLGEFSELAKVLT